MHYKSVRGPVNITHALGSSPFPIRYCIRIIPWSFINSNGTMMDLPQFPTAAGGAHSTLDSFIIGAFSENKLPWEPFRIINAKKIHLLKKIYLGKKIFLDNIFINFNIILKLFGLYFQEVVTMFLKFLAILWASVIFFIKSNIRAERL